ncbi:MAG: hypothetical protein JWN46_1424 [Acidimicrobiales bacterium]|nr:hypothetical protein [Acidimicrobiales bacterium]
MIWLFVVLAALLVVGIGLVVLGRETGTLAARPRSAVFELEEAVEFIADDLPVEVASQISHGDVRWVLQRDVDLLEEATSDDASGIQVVDEDAAIARILAAAEAERRDLSDAAVVAVLDSRLRYLAAIGALGPEAAGPEDPDSPAA